jgi:hypothetical protein
MKLTTTRTFLYFLAAIFLINLLQSYFTQLLFDEAYYWYYARKLAWGYFDHPPMVALMVKIGSFFFEGELGVRFISCILSAGTLVILWQMVELPKKKAYVPHFFALVFSMTLLNAYGFFTLPDTPLLFFTALFLWLYRKFVEKETIGLAISLGLVMAALMYSKYHAFLVIFFVLLSNLKLVLNRNAWLAVGVALLCYTPHLIWLYDNDFISIRYHLFERPNRAYDFNDYTLGFLVNLVALFGFTFPWIYQALFRTKAGDRFSRALLYLVYGVLLFFFVSSFQRRVQTQWIIVICIPMAVIAYHYMLEHPTNRKWLMRTAIANIAVLMILRVGLVYEQIFPVVFETHGNREWVREIETQVGDMPVIFENSYREAPMYAFYSGNTSYSLNNLFYRENQYNIDGSEALVQDRKILYIAKRFKEGDISYSTAQENRYYGKYFEQFESFRELECKVEPPGGNLQQAKLRLTVFNPYNENIELQKLKFALVFLNSYKEVQEVAALSLQPLESTLVLSAKDSTAFSFQMPEARKGRPSYFKIAISENGLIWGLNSKNIKLDEWNL